LGVKGGPDVFHMTKKSAGGGTRAEGGLQREGKARVGKGLASERDTEKSSGGHLCNLKGAGSKKSRFHRNCGGGGDGQNRRER